jgi:hypothetical protein
MVSTSLTAQEVPLTNWTVPPYRGTTSAGGGLSTMADITPGIGFVGVAPCRLVDTRQAGFPAGYGTPALTAGVPRSFDLKSDPLCTGIPTGVEAYSLNVTVTNTAGPGHLVIYPQGGAQPTVSSINYVAAQTIANAVIVPAGTNGGVTVVAGVSGTHLIIDINGYFIDQYNPGVSFHAVSSNVAPAILAENTSTVDNAVAVQGVITSPTPGSFATGVRGISNGYGVYGSSTNGFGVVATTGGTGPNSAVWARTTSSTGGSSGVFGWANGGGSASIFGGKFITDGVISTAAGVKGVSGHGDPLGDLRDARLAPTRGSVERTTTRLRTSSLPMESSAYRGPTGWEASFSTSWEPGQSLPAISEADLGSTPTGEDRLGRFSARAT